MDCPSISDSHGSNKRDNTIWQQAGCSEEDETQTFPGGTLCGPVLMCLLVSVKTTGVVCRCVYSTVVQCVQCVHQAEGGGTVWGVSNDLQCGGDGVAGHSKQESESPSLRHDTKNCPAAFSSERAV